MREVTKISIGTLVVAVAVAVLVVVLWPVVADAPWESTVKEESQVASDLAREFHNRGYARYEKGRVSSDWDLVQEAIEDFDKAIDLHPNYAQAYHNRGAAWFVLGGQRRTKWAIEDFSKAIELDAEVVYPHIAKVYVARSMAYFRLNEIEKQKADLKKACSFDSKYCGR